MASNSELDCPSWLNVELIELIEDFMPVLVNIKYDDNKKEMKTLPFAQHFLHYKSIGKVFFHHSRAMNSEAKCPIRPEFKLMRDFMPVLVIYKVHKYWLRSGQGRMCVGGGGKGGGVGTQWKVTPK